MEKMIIIKIAFAALKAVGNNNGDLTKIIASIKSQLIDIGGETAISKIEEQITKSSNELRKILKKDYLHNELKIPTGVIPYLQADIPQFLQGLNLADDILDLCDYNADKFGSLLYDEYKKGYEYLEYESEIHKVCYALAKKIMDSVINNEDFDKSILINLNTNNKNIVENMTYINKSLDDIKTHLTPPRLATSSNTILENRYKEYADKWVQNMFLNDFDEDDENAGTNIKLSELYTLPSYRLGGNIKSFYDLDERLHKYLSFSNKGKHRMLFIQGQPGIGKSTLITWFAKEYKLEEIASSIYIYRFTDFKGINIWTCPSDGERIQSETGLPSNLENVILILDGFDEVDMSANQRVRFLNDLYEEWFYSHPNRKLSLIITCRENYVDTQKLSCSYITLDTFDEENIDKFCVKFSSKTKFIISHCKLQQLIDKKVILGIPLILYMVLSLNVQIEEENSIVDIYDKIFAINGGIYDRCYKYSKWEKRHKLISPIKENIHAISHELAFWMFENSPSEAVVPNDKFIEIIEKQKSNIEKDIFLIANYFKQTRHTDGLNKIYFIHRSIYEYFVADLFFSLVKKGKKIEFILHLKKGTFSYEIKRIIIYKIKSIMLNSTNEANICQWMEECLNLDVVPLTLNQRALCFTNILNLFNKFIGGDYKKKNIRLDILNVMNAKKHLKLDGWYLNNYDLQHADLSRASMAHTQLQAAELQWAYLTKVNLKNAHLENAHLENAILKSATLSEAHLRNANLSGANLRYAHLDGADLRDVHFENTDLRYAHLDRADLRGAHFKNTDLRYAQLHGVNIIGVDFKGANLEGASFDYEVIFDIYSQNVNLYGANFITSKPNSTISEKYIFEELLKQTTYSAN